MYEVMILHDNPKYTNIKITRTMIFDDASESVSQRSGCRPCQCQLKRYISVWLTPSTALLAQSPLMCSSHEKAIAASNDLIPKKHRKTEKTSLRLMQEAPSWVDGGGAA